MENIIQETVTVKAQQMRTDLDNLIHSAERAKKMLDGGVRMNAGNGALARQAAEIDKLADEIRALNELAETAGLEKASLNEGDDA